MIVIEQAKGAIAQFHSVTVDEAFVLLRSGRVPPVAALMGQAGDYSSNVVVFARTA